MRVSSNAERVNFNFAENTVKTIAQRAATSIQYWCSLGHNFVLSEYFRSKHISAYRLDYTDKNYSTCLTLMIGAMKPVSLLFDQPTYSGKILSSWAYSQQFIFVD